MAKFVNDEDFLLSTENKIGSRSSINTS
jgi:hypothetical protein